MRHPYCECMIDVGESLQGGLHAASERMREAQERVAAANAGAGGRGADEAMASAARAAIFDEALLGALHSRLEEVKAVAK
jgi:hypothetical protein